MSRKRSFFERLTGSIRLEDDEDQVLHQEEPEEIRHQVLLGEEEDAQLTVDVYDTPTEIVVETMVAGVRPEDLDINISRDMITVSGRREERRTIREEDYFLRELYWGSFSRSISLPEEVDPEEAEAMEKHGLLIIKLPKIDKHRQKKIKVKTISS